MRTSGDSQQPLRRRSGSFPIIAQEEEWEFPNCCPGGGVGASQHLEAAFPGRSSSSGSSLASQIQCSGFEWKRFGKSAKMSIANQNVLTMRNPDGNLEGIWPKGSPNLSNVSYLYGRKQRQTKPRIWSPSGHLEAAFPGRSSSGSYLASQIQCSGFEWK